MSDLALDGTGDLEIVAGNLRLVTGAEAISQDWRARMTLFRGEWFLDQRVGIDYQADILVKNPREPLLRAIFTRVTLETAGVSELVDLSFALDRVTRTLAVTAEVLTVDGEPLTLEFNEVLLEDVAGGVA